VIIRVVIVPDVQENCKKIVSKNAEKDTKAGNVLGCTGATRLRLSIIVVA